MGENILSRVAWLALGACLTMTTLSMAEDRPAEKIFADIKAVEIPAMPDDREDQVAIRAFLAKNKQAMEQMSALTEELYKANPNHPGLASLMTNRWQVLARTRGIPAVKAEIEDVLARTKDASLLAEAQYHQFYLSLYPPPPESKSDESLAAFDVFARQHPEERRLPNLLRIIALRRKSLDARIEIFRRIEMEYPDSEVAKRLASAQRIRDGERRRLEFIGKSFDLQFTDAIKGTRVTMAGLKGKIVVVDFWATWCGPCVREMPKMKQLYAQYKEKGVEFIGVSLDQPKEKGGLDKLRDYIAKNGIEWPQYYQGDYFQSKFSSSWEVHSLPCVFLVDANGKLVSVDAHGKLELLIPEFLEKARIGATDAAPPP